MKKHPVDDLFKRRLTELEKTPSENAWLRIQQSAETRRRPALWVWYAAASILIALTAGYLVWEKNTDDQIAQVIEQKRNAAANKTEEVNPVKITEKDTSHDPIALNNNPSEAKEKLKVKAVKGLARHSVETITEEKVQTIPLLADIEKVSVPQNSLISREAPRTPEIALTSPGQVNLNDVDVEKSSLQKVEPAITIVVAVETNENQSEEKSKGSRFSRVFRQLKNARAGEKVDWEEVGFNPKNLVARVDDRLRTKEEKASERNQNPKERTKL